MSIWAVGKIGLPARCYVETTDATTVISQMEPGEQIAPVTSAQRQQGVVILGDMGCADILESTDD